MEFEASYPVVVTDRMAECRDFYVRMLGFEVVFEASWFLYLSAAEGGPHGIAFMAPDHPSAGVWVDVVEQIEPEPGFWERYAVGGVR